MFVVGPRLLHVLQCLWPGAGSECAAQPDSAMLCVVARHANLGQRPTAHYPCLLLIPLHPRNATPVSTYVCQASCKSIHPPPHTHTHLVAIVANVKVEVCEEVLVRVWLVVRPWLGLCLADEAPQGQVIVEKHLQGHTVCDGQCVMGRVWWHEGVRAPYQRYHCCERVDYRCCCWAVTSAGSPCSMCELQGCMGELVGPCLQPTPSLGVVCCAPKTPTQHHITSYDVLQPAGTRSGMAGVVQTASALMLWLYSAAAANNKASEDQRPDHCSVPLLQAPVCACAAACLMPTCCMTHLLLPALLPVPLVGGCNPWTPSCAI
jgi:hypothetical protein